MGCEMNKFISTESTLPGSVHLAQLFNLSETTTGRTLSLQHVIFKMVCLYVSTCTSWYFDNKSLPNSETKEKAEVVLLYLQIFLVEPYDIW